MQNKNEIKTTKKKKNAERSRTTEIQVEMGFGKEKNEFSSKLSRGTERRNSRKQTNERNKYPD